MLHICVSVNPLYVCLCGSVCLCVGIRLSIHLRLSRSELGASVCYRRPAGGGSQQSITELPDNGIGLYHGLTGKYVSFPGLTE